MMAIIWVADGQRSRRKRRKAPCTYYYKVFSGTWLRKSSYTIYNLSKNFTNNFNKLYFRNNRVSAEYESTNWFIFSRKNDCRVVISHVDPRVSAITATWTKGLGIIGDFICLDILLLHQCFIDLTLINVQMNNSGVHLNAPLSLVVMHELCLIE